MTVLRCVTLKERPYQTQNIGERRISGVLSPDPRHQGNLNRIIGGNPAFNNLWVIGGVDARMNGYPWVVQLKRPNAPTPGCGGGIINSRIEFLNFEINTFGKLLLRLSSSHNFPSRHF